MILLSDAGPGRPARVVAVFGAGLIGEATVRALGRRAALSRRWLPLDWDDAQRQRSQLAALADEMALASPAASGAPPRLDLLWSAGRAGFEAGPAETAGELASFRAVLAFAVRLAASAAGARVTFHLISSAGGLFEGQRQVDGNAVAAPRRPYSSLKHRQEDLLAAAPVASRIYRLSSVYGFVRPGQRIGLISVLLLNGIRQRVTSIEGRTDTLRDFVFVEDVAAFLARSILAHDAGGAAPPPLILAQGKPTSIWEVQRLIERVIGRRAYLSYSLTPANSEDTTFSRATFPAGWWPSDLASNVRRIYREALRSGAAFSPPRR